MTRVHVMDARGHQLIDERKFKVLIYGFSFKNSQRNYYFHVPHISSVFGAMGFVIWRNYPNIARGEPRIT